MRDWVEKGGQIFLPALQLEDGGRARNSFEFASAAPWRPDLATQYGKIYAEWEQFLSTVVAEGFSAGEFPADLDCEAMASLIRAFCDALTLHWVLHGAVVDPKEVSRMFVATMLTGMAVPSSRRPTDPETPGRRR
jgi:hypothetical protein